IVFLLLFYNFFIVISVRYGALLALGGRSSPDLQCSGGLSPGTFCEEFACSPRVHKGFPPIRTPTGKTCKNRTFSCPSLTKDGQFTWTWSPGAYKLPTAPGGSWRKDNPGWEKAEDKFTATSGLRVCVCVCPVSPPYIHVCANKT